MIIYYGMIVIATALFSLQFCFNSGYERECENDWAMSREESIKGEGLWTSKHYFKG